MKYNININQLVLSKTTLDVVDGAILDYIVFYCNSKNKKIEKQRVVKDGVVWTWINLKTLLEDMPLLRIKSISSLSVRIKKISSEKFIDTVRFGHQKLFVKTNSYTDKLFVQTNRAIRTNKQLLSKSYSSRRTNNYTNNSYTINNKKKIIKNFKKEEKPKKEFSLKDIRSGRKKLSKKLTFAKV